MVADRREIGSDLAQDRIEAEVAPEGERQTPDLWERLGAVYLAAGDFERAIDTLERLVSDGCATASTYEKLAQCARELKKTADEVRYREAAVDRRPEDPVLWRDLGVARRRAGATRDALASLREAMRLDPEDAAGTGLEFGRTLRELGDGRGAAAAFREGLRRRPDSSELWSELATAYSELGMYAESDQAVREALRLKPANAAAWHTIATNALKRGTRETAARAYQRMKELNPDFAEEILSWVSNTAGIPPDAIGDGSLAAVPPPDRRRGRLVPFRRPRA